MGFFLYTTITLMIVVAVFLIMLILIQKGRGGGLASAFGGGGGNTAFGSKTGDVLTWATSVVFAVFLLLCITLNVLGNKWHESKQSPTLAVPPASSAGQTPAGSPLPSPPGDATTNDQPAVPPINAPEPK
jgi:preprotein translocase subunit SecG